MPKSKLGEKESLLSTTDTSDQLTRSGSEENENKESVISTGARPKVRNPTEEKHRRFVMKQAKSPARTQALESVSEIEEKGVKHALLQVSKEDEAKEHNRKCPEFFGVRSYVHTFYEAMAMDDPQSYEDFGYDGNEYGGYLSMKKKRRRTRCLCKRICLWSGVTLLGFGLLVLLVGFLLPKRPEVVGFEEDIEIINRANQAFNKELDICKIIGIVVFCTGGCMVAGVLLFLTLTKRHRIEDPILSEDIPPMAEDEELPRSPTDARVPATEELASVQPKRVEPEEVVMTNAGLCKIPP